MTTRGPRAAFVLVKVLFLVTCFAQFMKSYQNFIYIYEIHIYITHFDKKNFFFLFWLGWVFIAACGLSLVAVSGGYSKEDLKNHLLDINYVPFPILGAWDRRVNKTKIPAFVKFTFCCGNWCGRRTDNKK